MQWQSQRGKYCEHVTARRWGDDPDTWHEIRRPSCRFAPNILPLVITALAAV